jgi:hypothetical protein
MSGARNAKKAPFSKKPPARRAAFPAPAPPPEAWSPSARAQFIAGGITVVLLALFIFSNTNGDIIVAGDDVWIITHPWHVNWNYFTHANRGYLMPFYSFLYEVNGQNTQRTHLFFFFLLVSSGLLLYSSLHKLLGPAPAVVGTIVYLGYSGKYETITWLAAGAYLICANVLFLSFWIALSDRLNPWVKGISITALNWFAVLLYEILLVAAPLYPLLYWLHHRLRRKPMPAYGFAATLLPLLMFFGHLTLMYLTTPNDKALPWQRGSTRTGMGLGDAAARIWPTFTQSLSAGMGREHWWLLEHEVASFWKYAPRGTYEIVLTLGVCAGIAFLLWFSPVVRLDKGIMVPLAVAGIYLTLFSPLIGFSTNPGFVPSRLLTLVGVGLGLLTAAAVSLALTARIRILRWVVPAMLLAAGGIEAAALNSILYEHQTAWAYDSRVRTQLLATGIRPRAGDTIFISLPERPLDGSWRVGFSQFESGHIETILTMDYGMLWESSIRPPLLYEHEIRRKSAPPVVPVARPGHQLFCFSVSDNDYRLTRIDCQ